MRQMPFLRTANERLADLEDFPLEPHYPRSCSQHWR